jgi:Aldolase/RraA
LGAYFGEVNFHIHLTLGSSGVITDGTVRDIYEIRATGFYVFARDISVSHSFAHLEDSELRQMEPDDPIPVEAELEMRFKLSRIAIRRAVDPHLDDGENGLADIAAVEHAAACLPLTMLPDIKPST